MTTARLGLACALIAALLAASVPATGAASQTATITSSTSVGFRVVVTATKGSDGAAPSATVNVAAFEKVAGTWSSLGRLRVGRVNGFFWKVVTGPHSIRFSIDTSSPERITLRLLLSPALGWSSLYRFHVQDGRLVSG